MKYTVTVHEVKKENNPYLQAMAKIVFGEKAFTVNGIKLLQNQNGELYVSFPNKVVYKNGEPVQKDGKVQYRDYANPVTKAFYEEVTNAIKSQYQNNTVTQIYHPNEPMTYAVRVTPYRTDVQGDPFRGFARLWMGSGNNQEFVVDDIRLYENQKGELFASMPGYKKEDKYIDMAYPASAEFRRELTNAFAQKYVEEIGIMQGQTRQDTQQYQTPEEETDWNGAIEDEDEVEL